MWKSLYRKAICIEGCPDQYMTQEMFERAAVE